MLFLTKVKTFTQILSGDKQSSSLNIFRCQPSRGLGSEKGAPESSRSNGILMSDISRMESGIKCTGESAVLKAQQGLVTTAQRLSEVFGRMFVLHIDGVLLF